MIIIITTTTITIITTTNNNTNYLNPYESVALRRAVNL